MEINRNNLAQLTSLIDGEVFTDHVHLTLYATDASAYQEKPAAVLIPRSKSDINKIVDFACRNKMPIIPRTAGTSLAGQVVGNGLIVDCSKYLKKVIEINVEEKWVRVEPGVVLDELNLILKKYGLFFGPETSTSNRCMVGGMVGNNSCGAHSIIYGSTRNHTLEVSGYLSDGSEVTFTALSAIEFEQKCKGETLEGRIYHQINSILRDPENQQRIRKEFPHPSLERRNTGYAIDVLLETEPFTKGKEPFNFSKLICGSEGTLMFITEIKLNLVPLPPPVNGLLVVHLESVEQALKANLIALRYNPVAVELIDDIILQCTKSSIEHRKNRFFVQGDPGALLCIEFALETHDEIERVSSGLIDALKGEGYGYHFPILFGSDISKVWALRKAGLGLLSNIPGDAKPQPVIEDTAVAPEYLPDYIKEFNEVLSKLGLNCVFYAHIATGELHLRPVINLKTAEGVKQFRSVATEIARLVKKYHGSLSGEHGDGRLRGEFIPYMIGEENYSLLKNIKKVWDPEGIFNPRKITDTPPMDTALRYEPGQATPEFETVFDFSETLGLIRMAEQCNGSADCRKSSIIGGTMCPSYQASFDEDKTTRARANMLRNILNKSVKTNPFDSKDLYNILDLCLSCKGCKSECPSGVDMAKLKAEFLYQYYKSNYIPLRTRLVAYFSKIQAIASRMSGIYNWVVTNKLTSSIVKKIIGFAQLRSLPKVHRITLKKWLRKNLHNLNKAINGDAPSVLLFIDEFTNYNDVSVGKAAVGLLNRLGYKILVLENRDSGRSMLSKGFLSKAKKLAEFNVGLYFPYVKESIPLIGIEPSAILAFRDEYPDLLRGDFKIKANELAKNSYTLEEFISKEVDSGIIQKSSFHNKSLRVLFHGHCQQKAISSTLATKKMLSVPENYIVEEIKSGCCGMAGSFGYEKEHFDLANKIGELVLFPSVRNADEQTVIVASGTSCRHHIKDSTGRQALHPAELLFDSLNATE
jgi:FAD/FMN-containing dehydrogenase/Fe-S oxidoreductase